MVDNLSAVLYFLRNGLAKESGFGENSKFRLVIPEI